MDKSITTGNKTVKKETMWMIASIALVTGFLLGVVFGVYKSGPGESIPQSMPSQQAEKNQGISAEIAAKISELEKKVSENPDDIAAWTNLGNLYFDTGNHEKAILAYTKSLELNPNNADVMTDLGIMYRRNGQPETAVATFDKAIKIDPNHETARYNKGVVLMHDMNDLEGAVRTWEELVRMNPAAMSPTGQPVNNLVSRLKETMNQR
ncbi:MAG: tetratricopeptide repeat protein [Desulfobacterales bacterium]